METTFRIFEAPSQIKPVQNRLDFMRRGADAYGGYCDSLALSLDWNVTVQEQLVLVYAVPVTSGGPHSFCTIELLDEDASLDLCITFQGTLHSATILPQEKCVSSRVVGNQIHCTVVGACHLLVEVNGRIHTPLSIFVRPPEKNIPDVTSPNVLYFAPGLHEVSYLELNDHQTVYIAGGAVLKAVPPQEDEEPVLASDWAGKPNYKDFIFANGKRGIRILGRGIIDTSALDWHARRTMCFTDCEDIIVDGPIMVGASHWTVEAFHCKNVLFEQLALFGYRENSDGIDIVSSQHVRVRHCFVRTGDDAICVKAMLPPPNLGGDDILVEYCEVWNDKVRGLGIAGESKSDIRNVTFRHCTVFHSLARWAYELGSLCIALCDSGTVSDILFENITIHQEDSSSINCILMRDRWSTDNDAGQIRGVRFKNITIPANAPIRLWGYDAKHRVEDVLLEHICASDGVVHTEDTLWLETNPYVSHIHIKK
ncbi:glycosyl hydrolase family 28 protein [Paenibacillus segetis]|uniref:Glycosyl hydrolases family 28 n=1 Tax=Paenibacillus segetis TaxID=1325360 RepID=A0ABQ1YK44_9BACL|nr:glycosyl hydrolase family 28 protein [Paenibacillus segetis]GGH28797.1 hypothetical protein GCM10008013_31020 [Paenibacillus segetis]